MRILIAGSGKVGETLAKQLSAERHDVTLIDSDPKVLASGVERYDVLAVQGNCASMKILQQANIEKADLLIAVTGSDELNLLCCMTAHMINPALHTIARIRDPEYTEQAYRMRDAFALSMIFNPEQQAAVEISRLLKLPGFFKREIGCKGKAFFLIYQIFSKLFFQKNFSEPFRSLAAASSIFKRESGCKGKAFF